MIGPQRLSLLDGEVLRRDYASRSIVDQFLDRLVDTFDFKIAESPAPKPVKASEESDLLSKRLGNAHASLKRSVSAPSKSAPWTVQTSKRNMVALMNEKLCLWILNASPDGEKLNPLELGWSTRNSESTTEDEDLVFHDNDEEDLPLECNYEIMTC